MVTADKRKKKGRIGIKRSCYSAVNNSSLSKMKSSNLNLLFQSGEGNREAKKRRKFSKNLAPAGLFLLLGTLMRKGMWQKGEMLCLVWHSLLCMQLIIAVIIGLYFWNQLKSQQSTKTAARKELARNWINYADAAGSFNELLRRKPGPLVLQRLSVRRKDESFKSCAVVPIRSM